jgi:hypothetical protein
VFGDEAEKQRSAVVVMASPTFGVVEVNADVGAFSRGSNNTVKLEFRNEHSTAVELRKVAVKCACTGARIPSGRIEPGGVVAGEVDLAVGKTERSLEKVFSLEVQGDGGIERIVINLKAKISGVVSFSRDIYTIEYSEESLRAGDKLKFKLPLVCSSDVDLSSVNLSVSRLAGDSSEAMSALLMSGTTDPGSRREVEVTLDPSFFKSDSEELRIQISGAGFDPQSARVMVRKLLPVSLISETLYFSPVDFERLKSICLIRAVEPVNAKQLNLLEVNLDSGERLSGKMLGVGGGIVRVELSCDKELATKFLKEWKRVTLVLESDGIKYSVEGRCRFQ